MNDYHKPVLLKEAIDLLQIKPGERYIDATLGGGGHTKLILEKGGQVLAIDLDQDALDNAREFKDDRLTLANGNFKDIDKIAHLNNFEKVSGILFDLGVSSHQIDEGQRGFSFMKQGPLDMRMDKESPITAEYLVNILQKGELYDIFHKLGQEHHARAISDSIVRTRRIKAIQTTDELVDVIKKAYGIKGELSQYARANISMRVFQALRIAVNGELQNIEEALPKAIGLLEKGGRIAVITFHSLEDRIVKNKFKEFEKEGLGQIITKKPIVPSQEEIRENSRSKSSKLRIIERI